MQPGEEEARRHRLTRRPDGAGCTRPLSHPTAAGRAVWHSGLLPCVRSNFPERRSLRMGHFLQINKALSNGRLQEWPKIYGHRGQSIDTQKGRGLWAGGDPMSNPCGTWLAMRSETFAYHALIRLAPIRASDENRLGFCPARLLRLCPGARLPLKAYAAFDRLTGPGQHWPSQTYRGESDCAALFRRSGGATSVPLQRDGHASRQLVGCAGSAVSAAAPLRGHLG